MKNISEEVIKQIKQEKIKPRSTWLCYFHNGLWWVFFIVAALAGALFLAVIFLLVSDIDWSIRKYLEQDLFSFVLRVVPFLWIILSFLAILLAYLNLRQTKRGYKYDWLIVLILIGIIVLMSSVILHVLKINQQTNQFLKNKVPYYKKVVCDKEILWSQPEKGLLAGTITIFVQGDDKIRLTDFNNNIWEITFGEDTVIHRKVKLTERELIKLIGTGKNLVQKKFEAREIMPWSEKNE